jgi:serine/threonine-protein kinase
MPPEQVTDAKRVGPPADLYALAATFFTMLTRETPIEMRPGQNHLLAVLEARPRSLRALNPAVPPGLDGVIARCLEKDPTRRYEGARELRIALNEAVKGS